MIIEGQIIDLESNIAKLYKAKQQNNIEGIKINQDTAELKEFMEALAQFKNELKFSQNNPPKTIEQFEVILQEYVYKS